MTNIEFLEEHIEQIKELLFDDDLQPTLVESVELELKYWESILKDLSRLKEYEEVLGDYRITEKIQNPQYMNDYRQICTFDYYIINKLGKLEDIKERKNN